MIVPRFWAQARLREKRPGRQLTLYRFGWSNESQAAAQQLAEERVRAAMARALAGERVPQREHKVPYNGADGLPIREEIVTEHGASVVTRNSYGARCLNTPDVLVADVDFDAQASGAQEALGCLGVLVLGLVLWVVTGSFSLSLELSFGAMVLLVLLLQGGQWLRVRLAGGPERLARTRVARFLGRHADWRLHVYRTPAGLRLIATHRRFRPSEPEVDDFFKAVGVDPNYRKMCRLQQCFRARLTAKPWRIGLTTRLRPRPGVWPVRPERRAERSRWLDDYETRAARFAACAHVETLGAAQGEQGAEEVRALHDELSRARSGLPIA